MAQEQRQTIKQAIKWLDEQVKWGRITIVRHRRQRLILERRLAHN